MRRMLSKILLVVFGLTQMYTETDALIELSSPCEKWKCNNGCTLGGFSIGICSPKCNLCEKIHLASESRDCSCFITAAQPPQPRTAPGERTKEVQTTEEAPRTKEVQTTEEAPRTTESPTTNVRTTRLRSNTRRRRPTRSRSNTRRRRPIGGVANSAKRKVRTRTPTQTTESERERASTTPATTAAPTTTAALTTTAVVPVTRAAPTTTKDPKKCDFCSWLKKKD